MRAASYLTVLVTGRDSWWGEKAGGERNRATARGAFMVSLVRCVTLEWHLSYSTDPRMRFLCLLYSGTVTDAHNDGDATLCFVRLSNVQFLCSHPCSHGLVIVIYLPHLPRSFSLMLCHPSSPLLPFHATPLHQVVTSYTISAGGRLCFEASQWSRR